MASSSDSLLMAACLASFALAGTARAAALPYLTGDAPLAPLARAYGFAVTHDPITSRVVFRSDWHEIVVAPGMTRALVDGVGVTLTRPAHYRDGRLVVPADLADLVRRMGSPEPSAGTPARLRPEPDARPRTAFLPPSAEISRLLLAGGSGVETAEILEDAVPSKAEESKRAAWLVVIDPGHGGADSGAVGPGGTTEKDVVLDIARRMAVHLRRRGVRVVLTRDTDRLPSLAERAAGANRIEADAFVSLHANSYRDPKVVGVETWVLASSHARSVDADTKSRALALALQGALVELLRQPDRGVRQGRYAVLSLAKVPAALVEIGFLSNPRTEKVLASRRWREKIAAALAEAIIDSGLLGVMEPVAPPPAPVASEGAADAAAAVAEGR